MKKIGKALYIFLSVLVKPAFAAVIGIILMKVFPAGGGWHTLGLIIVWGAVIYAVFLEVMIAVLIWLKMSENRFWRKTCNKRSPS